MEKDGQIEVEEEPLREPPDEGLQVPPKSYAEAVGDKEELDCKVHFVAAIEHNGCKIAKMTKDDTMEASTYWETAIPMCILGANPPIEVVEGFAKRIWEQADILDITMLKPGQFVVHFGRMEVTEEILKKSYYFFDNKPVNSDCKSLLKPHTPYFQSKDSILSIKNKEVHEEARKMKEPRRRGY
ncbi:unnamed protein product [Cuscuta campestris]|uniref:DUF4283 domain-containing protein n=1 Tax=Cuscuta campestris TaxID=132261 RepID=A0A484LU52_9ASTE|nr:unnamed protein product [Cuscuta campestris]